MVHLFDRQINLLEEINKILISLKHALIFINLKNNGYLVHQADEQENLCQY